MSRLAFRLAPVVPLLVLMPRLHAEYWTVSQELPADFQQLADAVAWAAEGDTIYVLDGTHDSVEIVGKSLYVAADHDGEVVVEGMFVHGLQAGQCVSLSGLEVVPPPVAEPALRIADCTGSVRLQDCLVHVVFTWSGGYLGIALTVDSASDVAASRCRFKGVSYYDSFRTSRDRYEPHAAFVASDSRISLSDCEVVGAMGSGTETGWPGVDVDETTLFLTATTVRGGPGFVYPMCVPTGDGGIGLIASGQSTVYLLDCAPEGGWGGYTWDDWYYGCENWGNPGPPVDLGPDVEIRGVPGTARSWTVDDVVEKEATLTIRYHGEPGDRVHAIRSVVGTFEVQPRLGGVELVGRPLTQSPCLGTAADGELVVELPISELDLPGHEDSFLLQVFAITADGRFRWAGPASLAVIGTDVYDPYRSPVHVDADAPPGGDGTSWRTAFDDLETAIAWTKWTYENVLPEVREIWIAEGEYVAPLGGAEGEDGFEITFPTTLRGGFAGFETSADQRDIAAHPTILDGDQLGDDGPDFQNYDDNARIVLRIDAWREEITLDGLVVRGGNGDGDSKTGGIRGDSVERLVVRNCELVANYGFYGGAGNFTDAIVGYYTGGDLEFMNTLFQGNRSFTAGGGLLSTEWRTTLVDCRFVDNRSIQGRGGGAYLAGQPGGPTLVLGCEFSGNEGKQGGGLFLQSNGPLPVVSSCTFRDNVASNGAGGLQVGNATALLHNSIFWNNFEGSVVDETTQVAFTVGGLPTPHFCCIDGWTGAWGGMGNHGLDPLFASGGRLGPGSPCIDAADNLVVPADVLDLDDDEDVLEPLPLDLDGNTRFSDDPAVPDTGVGRPPIVDMGAYERQGP